MPEIKREIAKFIPSSVKVGGRRVVHYGSNKSCPLCDANVRKYNPHGGKAPVLDELDVVGGVYRPDDSCPVCHSKDRTRLTYHYLFNLENIESSPKTVLHMAPELGLYMKLNGLTNIDYITGDIEPARYNFAKNIREMNALNLDLEDNSVDYIIASHIMEHIPDDIKVYSEFLRVLKPGGKALIMVPLAHNLDKTLEDETVTTQADRLRVFGQIDHVRIYTAPDLIARMDSVGFTTKTINGFEADPQIAQALELNPRENLFIGKKPAVS